MYDTTLNKQSYNNNSHHSHPSDHTSYASSSGSRDIVSPLQSNSNNDSYMQRTSSTPQQNNINGYTMNHTMNDHQQHHNMVKPASVTRSYSAQQSNKSSYNNSIW